MDKIVIKFDTQADVQVRARGRSAAAYGLIASGLVALVEGCRRGVIEKDALKRIEDGAHGLAGLWVPEAFEQDAPVNEAPREEPTNAPVLGPQPPAEPSKPPCLVCKCGAIENEKARACPAGASCERHPRGTMAPTGEALYPAGDVCSSCAIAVERVLEELQRAGVHGISSSDLERNTDLPSAHRSMYVTLAVTFLESRRIARQRGTRRTAWFDAKAIARTEAIRREGPRHIGKTLCALCPCNDDDGGAKCLECSFMGECGRAPGEAFGWLVPGAKPGEAYCAPCAAILRDVARELAVHRDAGLEPGDIATEIGEPTPDVSIALAHLAQPERGLAKCVEGRWYPQERPVQAEEVNPYGPNDRVKITKGACAGRLGTVTEVRAPIDGFVRLIVQPDPIEQSRRPVDKQCLTLADVEPIAILPKGPKALEARKAIVGLLEKARAEQMRRESAGGGDASAKLHAAKEAINRGHHLALGAAGEERGNAIAYLRRLVLDAKQPLRDLLADLAATLEKGLHERKQPAPGDEIVLKIRNGAEGLVWVEPPPGGPAHLEPGHSVRDDDFACVRKMIVRFEFSGNTTSKGARGELARIVRVARRCSPKEIVSGLEYLEESTEARESPEQDAAPPAPPEPPAPPRPEEPIATEPTPTQIHPPAEEDPAMPPSAPADGKRRGRKPASLPDELLVALRGAIEPAKDGIGMKALVEACAPHKEGLVKRGVEDLDQRKEIHMQGAGRGCRYYWGPGT